MILIDIDVRFNKLDITSTGMVFELRDYNNPDTVLILQFYKPAIDYMRREFDRTDRKKIGAELRVEFVKREEVAIKGLREELDELRMEYAIVVDQLETERKEDDTT